jgi:hypothetical protein
MREGWRAWLRRAGDVALFAPRGKRESRGAFGAGLIPCSVAVATGVGRVRRTDVMMVIRRCRGKGLWVKRSQEYCRSEITPGLSFLQVKCVF